MSKTMNSDPIGEEDEGSRKLSNEAGRLEEKCPKVYQLPNSSSFEGVMFRWLEFARILL